MSKNLHLKIGVAIISLMFLLAVFGPWFAPFDPQLVSLPDRFQTPSVNHWMGTDQDGADIFSKILYGARISFFISLIVVSVSILIGITIGSISGYFGGKIDVFVMRFIDMLHAFPGFLLAISVVAVMGSSVGNLILALCLTGWTAYARLVRAECLHLKTKEYVQSAVAMGAGHFKIITAHIIPNILSPLLVQASFGMAAIIMAESSLSFLGLGVPPTEPSWGSLLNAGRKFIVESPHISFFPGSCILLLVLGFNFLGDGLRDHFDPKKQSGS